YADLLDGQGDGDIIIGRKGNDLLLGGDGHDQLFGDIWSQSSKVYKNIAADTPDAGQINNWSESGSSKIRRHDFSNELAYPDGQSFELAGVSLGAKNSRGVKNTAQLQSAFALEGNASEESGLTLSRLVKCIDLNNDGIDDYAASGEDPQGNVYLFFGPLDP